MISKKQPESFRAGEKGEHRMFIFFCDVFEEGRAGADPAHFFMFDARGWVYESRYFCDSGYILDILASIRAGTEKKPVYWELVPHGKPPLPSATYRPRVQQIALNIKQEESPLMVDKLYAFETLQLFLPFSPVAEPDARKNGKDTAAVTSHED